MKVSVIIPTFNRGQYICQAIESVLNQTISDCELIIVDDGSTDNTNELLKPYGEQIRYLYSENRGVAHARNLGMKVAQGDYIAWLDSDDLYYPYKIELQANVLDKFPDVGMVYTEFSGFDDLGYFDEFHLKTYHSSAYESGGVTYDDIFDENVSFEQANMLYSNWKNRKIYMGNIYDFYFSNIIVFTNSIMFRKGILDEVGFQNSKFGLFHDLEFLLRCCRNNKTAFIDVPTYKLRYHGEQISGVYKKTDINIVIEKQMNLLKIGEEHGLKNNEYYQKNRKNVDERMGHLHKALVVPLLAKGNKPKTARYHLKKCKDYGRPERLLWVLSYFPYFLRRISLKALTILRQL